MNSHRHCSPNWFFVAVGLSSALLSLGACSSSDPIGALGEGGGTSTAAPSGGTSGNGGAQGAGGVLGAGGANGTGGAQGLGGVVGTGGASSKGGALGTGGQAGEDAASPKTDALLSTDAQALAQLCASTGGQLKTQECCGSVGDFPDTCSIGACGCPPSGSHTVTVCACLNMGCFSPTVGCNLIGLGGTGGASTTGGSGGGGEGGASGGAGGTTGFKLDAPVSTDANPLAALCTSTGGQVKSQSCCSGTSDFPESCLVGSCGCGPDSSHTVSVCQCPSGLCYYPALGGCVRGLPGSGLDASTASDAGRCTAQPGQDTYCGGTRPPSYYACVGSPPSASCVLLSIGDMTDGYCCP